MIILVFFASVFAASALPATTAVGRPCSNNIQHVGFERLIPGLKALNQPLEINEALVRIDRGDKRYCSGSRISDAGHIVTAAHCLDSCRVEAKRAFPLTCTFRLNGVDTLVQLSRVPKCLGVEVATARSPFATPDLKHCKDGADIAIVKPVVAGRKSAKCLQLGDGVDNNAAIMALGMPVSTDRAKHVPTAKDAPGDAFVVSSGTRVAQDYCVKLREVGPKNTRTEVVYFNTDLREYREAGFNQMDVDTYKGASGSPVADQAKQRVQGVAAVIGDGDHHNAESECKGAAFFESVERLWNAPGMISDPTFKREDLKCTNGIN